MRYLACAIFILVLTSIMASAEDLEIFGYFEPQYTGLYHNDEYHQFYYNKLRVDLKSRAIRNVELGANIIYIVNFGKKNWNILNFLPDRIASSIPPEMQTAFQLSYRDTLFLDNVYARIANNRIALTVGKQQISLGTGYFSNPIDLFNTKDALDPTYEQPGHNALRFDLMLDHRLSLMALYSPVGEDWEASKKFGRAKIGIGHFDFALIGGILEDVATDFYTLQQTKQQQILLGGDIAGQLIGLGVWIEGGYNFLKEDDDFYEFIAGADYTFENGLYALIEYHHNSNGESDYNQYDLNDWMHFFTGESKTICRDQIYGYVQYPIYDFINIGNSLIFSVSDQSAVIAPTINYNIFENVDLTIMVNFYLGTEGKAFSNKLGCSGFLRGQVYF